MTNFYVLLIQIASIDLMVHGSQNNVIRIPEEECEYRNNFTDVDVTDLSGRHYRILEHCLYYYLSDRAQKRGYEQGLSQEIPPHIKYLIIRFREVIVKSILMSRIRSRAIIEGKLRMAWNDSRLRYDKTKWIITSLKIQSQYHIWAPDFEIMEDRKSEKSMYSGFDYYENIQISPKGLVTADLPFNAFAVCTEDFSRYPDDHKTCCFRIRTEFFRQIIRFNLAQG